MKKVLLNLLLSFILLAGCKKYDEDNSFTLSSPTKRIIKDWKVTQTKTIQGALADTIIYTHFNFTNFEGYSTLQQVYREINYTLPATYRLEDNQNALVMDVRNTFQSAQYTLKFKIIKLYKDELIIEDDSFRYFLTDTKLR